MSPDLLLNNLILYSLQIGLLVGLAAFVPGALRLRLPSAKLVYWQMLLAACLALPLLRPWKQAAGVITFRGASVAVPSVPVTAAAAPRFTQTEIALAILALGILARLVWLAVGFVLLQRYRRNSAPLPMTNWSATLAWGVEADLRVSEDISSPVTFGLFKPVVLLPATFHELAPAVQEAILAHECLHVRRKDWLLTLVEAAIRALFWFHPAVWWLLAEIELAREQSVDRLAVELTKGREEYVDALLAVAGAGPALELAPAPPFLRKRRLKHRVVAILKHATISRERVVSTLAAAVCMLAAASWIASGAFPLVAAPKPVSVGVNAPLPPPAEIAQPVGPVVQATSQLPAQPAAREKKAPSANPAPTANLAPSAIPAPTANPASIANPAPNPPTPAAAPAQGVLGGILGAVPNPVERNQSAAPEPPLRIKVGGNVQLANIVRKVSPQYPPIARAARIQDHVILRVLISTDGTVQDIWILGGHPLLRMAAIDAVRQWVYKPTMLNGTPVEVETEVDVNFTLAEGLR